LAGWLAQLATSAFNQLAQYVNSPGHMTYCYAELAIFFPSGGHSHHLEGWPGLVDLSGWLYTEVVHPPTDGQPSKY